MSPSPHQSRAEALALRTGAAQFAADRQHPDQISNSDEVLYPNGLGNFTKGLEHDSVTGEVANPAHYRLLVDALLSEDIDRIAGLPPVAGVTKQRAFVNPRAGLAFDLEGPDCRALTIPPAPVLSSAQAAGEAVELYWMARLRDVAFTDYATDATAAAAVSDLNVLADFRGPRDPAGGQVTVDTLFRGETPGELVGPYLSQFLLLDVPFGTLSYPQRQTTAASGADYLTTWGAWLDVQNGEDTSGTDHFDSTKRYIRNGRDLATYVHFDALYEAYLNACLILLGGGARFDPGNPYTHSPREAGFGTFGGPHILSLVCEVATRALKAVWHQKWFVHRRLRPEAYGGWVERSRTSPGSYPIHSDVLESAAVAAIQAATGSALLPMAFPEGSPMHPAYGAGHATVAGACVTVLKAWFDESFPMAELRIGGSPGKPGTPLGAPRIPDAAGTGLVSWSGADQLTVGGELNKVAANIAIGRNHAGVHWYTDYVQSLRLGEEVAIRVLQEQKPTYLERGSFSLVRFDGTSFVI
ncbi:vanadium-dependent haloperoxidase [Frankia sp. CiP3]|uniref:vanadium-dependent haloperoxidase n=1 Tax=Frankia sp. CiP3 TaxID=2880971 RepID=UPI001EF6050E|nr:vanadium-dependent haloperoxidase [Frankia sp. CiP3]